MIKTLDLIAYLLVLLIHVYIVVLGMMLWKTRGPRVFRITPEKAAETAAMASNQGLYNGFLVVALVIGLIAPDPAANAVFALFSLICVAVAGIWDVVTVNKRISFVQTVPATTALALGRFVRRQRVPRRRQSLSAPAPCTSLKGVRSAFDWVRSRRPEPHTFRLHTAE